MKNLIVAAALVAATGCAGLQLGGTKLPDVTAADVVNAGACFAQVQSLSQTAKQQVSSCVELGASIKARIPQGK